MFLRITRVLRPVGFLLAVTLSTGGAFFLAVTLSLAGAFAASFTGAIYTTTKDGTAVNQNIYGSNTDVYLSGGPQNTQDRGLPPGTYYFQITDPSGKTLLSTDPASCRQLEVGPNGRVNGSSPSSGACKHQNGTFNPANGTLPVQMAPFSSTPNAGLEYKAWLIAQTKSTSISLVDNKVINFSPSDSKTDNFKVQAGAAAPPPGSCQPSSSLSVLVTGTTVVSYVPKGSWSSSHKDVAVVGIENSTISATIPTPNPANSCASNPLTGTTVCTADNTDVYLISGTTLNTTLTSGGSLAVSFSGGSCTNCGVMMDAVHNKAAIGLSISGVKGFQFLNLATNSFEPAFASPSTDISEDPLIDPTRNLLLSPGERGIYEIVNVTTSTSPTFFENPIVVPAQVPDSAGEDCSTGIAMAPREFSLPSVVFIADLTQAIFTPAVFPAPAGTWTAPSQNQSLTESFLSAGASGMAVAQGTHTGVVTGEFSGNNLTAIALPATSGTGIPAITDWVTCNMGPAPVMGGPPLFETGADPHTVTAYQSPTSGDAIALVANGAFDTVTLTVTATELAVVDLTKMLDPTIVPRTVGGHGCASIFLPSTVVSFVPVP